MFVVFQVVFNLSNVPEDIAVSSCFAWLFSAFWRF